MDTYLRAFSKQTYRICESIASDGAYPRLLLSARPARRDPLSLMASWKLKMNLFVFDLIYQRREITLLTSIDSPSSLWLARHPSLSRLMGISRTVAWRSGHSTWVDLKNHSSRLSVVSTSSSLLSRPPTRTPRYLWPLWQRRHRSSVLCRVLLSPLRRRGGWCCGIGLVSWEYNGWYMLIVSTERGGL